MIYLYENIWTEPNLDGIHSDVFLSTMINKSISYCRWDESNGTLSVVWDEELNNEDKFILDTIVSTNQ